MNNKEKAISTAGICTNCGHKRNCDFTIGINAYIRDNKHASHISDAEIAVYSCDDYKTEIEQVCEESEMCVYCNEERKEEGITVD